GPISLLVPRFKSFDPPQADLRFTTHKESKIRRGIPQRGTTHKDYGIRREVPRSGKARPRRACPGEAFKRRRNLEPKSYF
ncbi:MAG: hypothetical protein OES70_05790, partial [Desulfobacterales bacterium]|nr:hypothetical protein [Desulfobacterales bacterium]